MRQETADEVIDAAKEFTSSSASRSPSPQGCRAGLEGRAERPHEAHRQARANKADAIASRARPRSCVRNHHRQVVANAARKQQQSNKEAKDKTIMFAAGGIKDMHDTIYKKKFVPRARLRRCKTPSTPRRSPKAHVPL